MHSITSHASLGDPKYGGALFLLPREIRDKIYGLLFKGHYRQAWILHPPHHVSIACIPNYDQSDFSVLRLSKIIGSEATEILYSDSVFRFIMSEDSLYYDIKSDLDCLKEVVPLIKNIIFDVDTPRLNMGDWVYEPSTNYMMRILEGIDARRQSLQVRMLDCNYRMLEESILANLCRRLKTFVGFRSVTVEVLPVDWLPRIVYHFGDDAKKGRKMEELISLIKLVVAEELEPAFGPAVSGFKSDTGDTRIPDSSLSSFGGTSLVGFLNFHPGRHLARKDTAEEQG